MFQWGGSGCHVVRAILVFKKGSGREEPKGHSSGAWTAFVHPPGQHITSKATSDEHRARRSGSSDAVDSCLRDSECFPDLSS